eukprot:427277_1
MGNLIIILMTLHQICYTFNTITTLGSSKYQNSVINCTDTDDCEVICGFGPSCYKTTILCPSGRECLVSCLGDEACYYTNIHGVSSTQLTVECSGLGSCSNTNIYCPSKEEKQNATKPCIIPADSTRGYNVWGISIYAINSWNDVDLPGQSNLTHGMQMFCGDNYEFGCGGWSKYGCVCPQTLYPTHLPTVTPSVTPSFAPFNIPTTSPSTDPSVNPTISPMGSQASAIGDNSDTLDTKMIITVGIVTFVALILIAILISIWSCVKIKKKRVVNDAIAMELVSEK